MNYLKKHWVLVIVVLVVAYYLYNAYGAGLSSGAAPSSSSDS